MLTIIRQWLMSKLGIYCANFNIENVGEKFKDGVLLARLLQKYHVIPTYYALMFKETDYYAACLRNIQIICVWLEVLEIRVEQRIIHEIACAQTVSTLGLLYQLYFKLESSESGVLEDRIHFTTITKKISYNCLLGEITNSTRHLNNERTRELITLDYKPDLISRLFHDLRDVQCSATDWKINNKIDKFKNYTLDFVAHNVDFLNEIFVLNINKVLKTKCCIEKNEICENIITNLEDSGIIYNGPPVLNELQNSNHIMINDENTELKLQTTSSIDTFSSYKLCNIQHTKKKLGKLETEFQDESIKDPLTLKSSKNGSNEHESYYDSRESRNLFNKYLQHIEEWSSRYLNIDDYKYDQSILSQMIKEVLNFEYCKSEVKHVKIKKHKIAGIIEGIHNAKVIKLLKEQSTKKEILCFTIDDAITTCLNKFKEEMMISENLNKICQVIEEEQKHVGGNIDDISLKSKTKYSRSSMTNVSNSQSVSNLKPNSAFENTEHKKKCINKQTQTPESIPEPDYLNPELSALASLGKIIVKKQLENLDLQNGDTINIVVEYIKEYQEKNGWVLLDFPIQPAQMALFEYKLTGKLPSYGQKKNYYLKKKSLIAFGDSDDNTLSLTKTYLTHYIKIVNSKNIFKDEHWNDFLLFYRQHDCIKVLVKRTETILNQSTEAADNLLRIILNNKEGEMKLNRMFKIMNIFSDIDVSSSENEDMQLKECSFIVSEDTSQDSEMVDRSTIKLQQNDFIYFQGNITDYTALHLCYTWENMEHSYIYRIKEILNSRETIFEELILQRNSITNTFNNFLQFQNPCMTKILQHFQNINTNSARKNNSKRFKSELFKLQNHLWDQADNELIQTQQYLKNTFNEQWKTDKLKSFIEVHKDLLKVELNRTMTTFDFITNYYNDGHNIEIGKFQINATFIDTVEHIEQFETACINLIQELKNEVNKYGSEFDLESINQIQMEMSRFIDKTHRIRACLLLDAKKLNNMSKVDEHLETIKYAHNLKISDINDLCLLFKCIANLDKTIKGDLKQKIGRLYINELSVNEIVHKKYKISTENFAIENLEIIINALLNNVPDYKMCISELISILNDIHEKHSIYPTNWPKTDRFYNHFPKHLLGSIVTTIDWRDFAIQCLEIPYPQIDELLFYRKLFKSHDIGNETINKNIYKTTRLWFENGSQRSKIIKWLLYDMYKAQNHFNYSAMLLAFCRDIEPWIGLQKAFCLIFGWNPSESSKTNQFYNHFEALEEDIEENNSDIHLLNQLHEFNFDENTMTWFMKTSIQMYLNNEGHINNLNISDLVKSVFTYFLEIGEAVKINSFFNNERMNIFYDAIYKFKTQKLCDIVTTIEMDSL